MNDWIAIVSKHHADYVKIVRSWGEYDYSEDIVQEMYIKLLKYTTAEKIIKHGQVNKGYVWFTLRSVFNDYLKEKNRIEKFRIGDGFDIIDDIEEQIELKSVNNYVDSWEWYDKMLFKLYINTDLSIRQIAKETGISLTSVFYTIKTCKNRIKNKVKHEL